MQARRGESTRIEIFVEPASQKSSEFQSKGLAALERFDSRANWLRALLCEASWKSQ